MSTPLSTHSVHVPPRQTVHVVAELREEAESIVLTDVAWERNPEPMLGSPIPRESLFLGVGEGRKQRALAPGATSFDIEPAKTVNVVVGNWSDTPLEVSFEIWGKS